MFEFRNGSLYAESVSVEAIASEHGTPRFVHSRAALYEAWHDIIPVRNSGAASAVCDVVGPVCESADFPGKEGELAVDEGNLLAVASAGAYAMCISSDYNSRPRAAEIMADGARTRLIRELERPEALFALEHLLR